MVDNMKKKKAIGYLMDCSLQFSESVSFSGRFSWIFVVFACLRTMMGSTISPTHFSLGKLSFLSRPSRKSITKNKQKREPLRYFTRMSTTYSQSAFQDKLEWAPALTAVPWCGIRQSLFIILPYNQHITF